VGVVSDNLEVFSIPGVPEVQGEIWSDASKVEAVLLVFLDIG